MTKFPHLFTENAYLAIIDNFTDKEVWVPKSVVGPDKRIKQWFFDQKKKELRAFMGKKKQSSNKTEKPVTVKEPSKIREDVTEENFKPDEVCNTFCSTSMDKKECTRFRMNAQLACSIIMKRYSKYEIEQAILGTYDMSLEELLKEVMSERNLTYNDQVLLCAQRELTNLLMKKELS